MSKKDSILYNDSDGHIPIFQDDQQMQDFTKRYQKEVKKLNEKNESLGTPLSEQEISAKAFEIAKEGMRVDTELKKHGLQESQQQSPQIDEYAQQPKFKAGEFKQGAEEAQQQKQSKSKKQGY